VNLNSHFEFLAIHIKILALFLERRIDFVAVNLGYRKHVMRIILALGASIVDCNIVIGFNFDNIIIGDKIVRGCRGK